MPFINLFLSLLSGHQRPTEIHQKWRFPAFRFRRLQDGGRGQERAEILQRDLHRVFEGGRRDMRRPR